MQNKSKNGKKGFVSLEMSDMSTSFAHYSTIPYLEKAWSIFAKLSMMSFHGLAIIIIIVSAYKDTDILLG